ncbi:MAG: AAA family ATPase, partial [Polyangiaceae bacterium]
MPDLPPLQLSTLLYIRQLASGDSLVAPIAGPNYASIGDEAVILSEQRLFLEELLSKATPDVLARYALPDSTRLQMVDVKIPREDLPRRQEIETSIAIPCVVLPSEQDQWVVALPLEHTMYVEKGEELEEVVRNEVQRIASAEDRTPLEYLRLLPARSARLETVSVTIRREEKLPPGRASQRRKAIADRTKMKMAEEVLATVSTPLHELVDAKHPYPVHGREKEIKTLSALLDGEDRLSAVLVGPDQVGKSAVIRAWLEQSLASGKKNRVYATSTAQLIAGMSALGQWEERVRRVMEAIETLDAVLYFDNLGEMLSERTASGGVDIPGAMKPYIEEGRVRLVGELRAELLDLAETQNVGFFSSLTRIRIDGLDAAAARAALEKRIAHDRQADPTRPVLAKDAIQPLIDLAERYLPYRAFPGKAVRLYEELRGVQEGLGLSSQDNLEITRDRLYETFALQSGIPAFLLREDRALHVAEVEEFFRGKVIGQDQAVKRVADTVGVVKAGLQPQGKPLATFLFVGPTGVGKTELARALALFLFGSVERMIRFDMSEYMDVEAADRLIRGTGRSDGLLTRRVREQPFCVLLLDEIEKAHPAVFDLLLQVCGEGRLTDARGRTAYFHNAIIILTSNLGAASRRPSVGFGSSTPDDDAFYLKQVHATFRPEFVNRIDRLLAFRALQPEQVEQVAQLALTKVALRRGFLQSGMTLNVTPEALRKVAIDGYSEAYGARALRRQIENSLVAPISRTLSKYAGVGEGEIRVSLGGTERASSSTLALVEENGLSFLVTRRPASNSTSATRSVKQISDQRRQVARWMRLERVQQIKSELEFTLTQLSYGNRSTDDKKTSTEIAELQATHHFLEEIWKRLEQHRDELEAAEELAITSLFAGESTSSFSSEAESQYRKFLRALPYALLALEASRDSIFLLAQELNTKGGLEVWLLGLLGEAAVRSWTVQVHFENDKPGPEENWSPFLRWGPPRGADRASNSIKLSDTSQAVLVRVTGSFAGVLLALEAGLHRWQADPDKPTPELFIRVLTLRSKLEEADWQNPLTQPLAPQGVEIASKAPTTRLWSENRRAVTLMRNEATVSLADEDDYWRGFNEIAARHLL